MLRVFNLTDVPTATLTAAGLVDVTLTVGRSLIPPGGQAEVIDDHQHRAALDGYLSVGAVALTSPPASYVLARVKTGTPIVPPTPKKSKKKKRL